MQHVYRAGVMLGLQHNVALETKNNERWIPGGIQDSGGRSCSRKSYLPASAF